jgi:uncharacterized repeat protein (TIGR01451 family)
MRIRSYRFTYHAAAVLLSLAVLPSCRNFSGNVLPESFTRTVSKPAATEQGSREQGSTERTLVAKESGEQRDAAKREAMRRDPEVRVVSDEQAVGEAAPAANGAPVQGVPLPAPAKRVTLLPGRPTKPVVAGSLPALPREYEHAANCAPPIPYGVVSPWAPPGIKGPWPQDEFLHDGGDAHEPVAVSPEWRVQGLNVEDTVAHYDTLDGRTLVEQSNCAYIYAPRFSSVRTVTNAISSEFIDAPTNITEQERLTMFSERARIGTKLDQQQPVGRIANIKLGTYRGDQGINFASTALMPQSYQQSFYAYENLSIIRSGSMLGSEKARLAERSQAAIAWSKADGVKVLIDRQKAGVVSNAQKAAEVYVVKGPTDARLRICKIASTPAAQPGDIVEFTIRYDNVGDATVGNIVILDSLTTRLAYVPESAQSSRQAYFSFADNSADSLELRWEIDEPLKPGEGGLVRFKCKVR